MRPTNSHAAGLPTIRVLATVAAAEDGDTVLLQTGRHPESVTVTNATTIRGEEPGAAAIEVALGCITDPESWETTCPPEVPLCRDENPHGFVLEGAHVTTRPSPRSTSPTTSA